MKAALVVRTDVSSIRGIEDVARDDSITPIVLQSSGFYWLFRTSKSETFQRVYKRIHRRRGDLPDKDMFSVTTLKRILKVTFSSLCGKAVIIMMQTPVTASVKARCEQLGALDAEFYYAPNPIFQIPMAMFMRKDIDPWFRNGVGEQCVTPSFPVLSSPRQKKNKKKKRRVPGLDAWRELFRPRQYTCSERGVLAH
ncbi:unnamed protein product [Ixodes pacificus]